MKCIILLILWLFISFYSETFSMSNITETWFFIETTDSVNWSPKFNQLLPSDASVSWDNSLWLNDSVSNDFIRFWDLEIKEIFPSSWNCLDEYFVIVAHRDFSWYIDVLGAWTSSWIVTIWINVYSWEQIIVTDNIASMKTTNPIILLSSITLTNWWEILQLRYSWLLLDDVFYSDPRSPKSLIYTESIDWKRYFKTIVDPEVQTYCLVSDLVKVSSPIIWWCSLEINNSHYNWSGNYILSLAVPVLSWCSEWSSNKRFNWFNQIDVNVCQTLVEVGPWVHRLQYYAYSDTWTLLCSDELYFASQYDVWYIQLQWNSPWQCQYDKKQSNNSSQSLVFYDSKNCWIELQSPKLWFTVDSSLNVRVLLDNTWLNDSQKTYSCIVDFWNGERINECNPSSFRYHSPWVYVIWTQVKDNRTGQQVCSHVSFIYIPPSLTRKDINNVSYYYSSGNDSLSWLYCSWMLSGLYIDSIMPNPKWNDSLQEKIVIHNNLLSWDDLSQFILKVWKRNFSVSWEIVWHKVIMKNTFWLINKWMCFDLIHKFCGLIHRVCYGVANNDDLFSCLSQDNANCLSLALSWNNNHNTLIENSCFEKINKLKNDHKLALTNLREKYKNAIIKLRTDNKKSLQIYKENERISRNIRYIRERSFQLFSDNVIDWNPSFILYHNDIQTIAHLLASYIEKKTYFIHQDSKKKVYMYDIRKYISKFITQDSLMLYLLPDSYEDFLDYLIIMENL